jgi:hypothetical protein
VSQAGQPRLPRFIHSFTQSWEDLFGEAAEFAGRLGPGALINISHSEDDNEGVVAVWYWDDLPPA